MKISPEQKAIIARYAANHGIVNAIIVFERLSREFSERKYDTWMEEGLFERTFFAEKLRAGKDMTIEKLGTWPMILPLLLMATP